MTHPTRGTVLAAAAAAYSGAALQEAMAALDEYGVEPSEHERERVQLAILKLSAGDLERLIHNVQVAKRDYRDILW